MVLVVIDNIFPDPLNMSYFLSCEFNIFLVEDSFQQASNGSGGPGVDHTCLWDPCRLLCLLEQVLILNLPSISICKRFVQKE